LVGATIGWGLAGLDGGIAGTVEVPAPNAAFVATGTVTSAELGTMLFKLASNGQLVHQVLVLAESREEMLFDRAAAKVTLVDGHELVEIPLGRDMASLLEPFERARRAADGPLDIVRDGNGSHLGFACDRYRATGVADGQPLSAVACITADGIPLVTEIVGAHLEIRTQINRLDRDAAPAHLVPSPSDRPGSSEPATATPIDG
jgi:hypothetical protein